MLYCGYNDSGISNWLMTLDFFSGFDYGWGSGPVLGVIVWISTVVVPLYFISSSVYWYHQGDYEVLLWRAQKLLSKSWEDNELSGFIGGFHFLFSVVFVIFWGSVLGLFPGIRAFSISWINVGVITFVCWLVVSSMCFVSMGGWVLLSGVVFEGVPYFLMFISMVSEVVSFLVRPFVLMFRFALNLCIGQFLLNYCMILSSLVLHPFELCMLGGIWGSLWNGLAGVVLVAEGFVVILQNCIMFLLLILYLAEAKVKGEYVNLNDSELNVQLGGGKEVVVGWGNNVEALNSKLMSIKLKWFGVAMSWVYSSGSENWVFISKDLGV